ncbi:MAG: esterase-like activity of phytase family protein [Alphaproteobacteria bacterium]
MTGRLIQPVIMAGILLAFACPAPPASGAEIRITPVQMNAENRDEKTIGNLTWRGGFAMTMENPLFGGLSGLEVSPDGRRLLAVTDNGYWLRAELTYRDGDLAGIRNAELAPLLGQDGRPLGSKPWSDAESLAPLSPDSFVVAFERHHRLWRYDGAPDPSRARPVAIPVPPAFSKLPANGGIEALTRLCNGNLLAIAERNRTARGHVDAWLQSGSGWDHLTYLVSNGLRPTAATTLPDCDILIVERSFSFIAGLGIRIVRIPSNAIRPDAVLVPREIARMTHSVIIDNFEGISSRRNEIGETLVYIVSDDNFSPLQRSLLVMYRLDDTER